MEDNVPVREQYDVVAVKCEFETEDPEVAAGTVEESSTPSQIKVKTEPGIDIDRIKEECDMEYAFDKVIKVKFEEIDCTENFGSDVGDECEVRGVDCERLGVIRSGTTDDTLRFDCVPSDSVEDKRGVSEDNVGCSTIKTPTYISGNAGGDANDFESLSDLKSEEVDLGCDVIDCLPNPSSPTAADDDAKNTCKVCDKNFSSSSLLRQHMSAHSVEKPHVCNICEKTFARKVYLRRHMSTHNGEKPHECKICGKKFAQKGYLNSHELAHNDKKPITCKVCGKKFAHYSNLHNHMLTHTGEKPHTCKLCNKKFSLKINLNDHMRIHIGEKPHACEICKKQFILKSYLKRHMVMHSGDKPHSCTVCGKKFSRSYHLNFHMQLHSDERSHTCEICKKTFATKNYLTKHIATHTRTKPRRRKRKDKASPGRPSD